MPRHCLAVNNFKLLAQLPYRDDGPTTVARRNNPHPIGSLKHKHIPLENHIEHATAHFRAITVKLSSCPSGGFRVYKVPL